MALSPVSHLEANNVEVDRRHDRRELTAAELTHLLAITRVSKRTQRGMTGEDRFHLYFTACGTGFRAGSLTSLTPDSFDLDDRFVNHFPADGAIDKMGGFCQYRASQGPSTLVQGGTRCRIHSPLRWKFPSNNANNSKRCYGLRQRRKPWCFAVALCCDVDMRAIRPTCKWATSSVAIDTPSRYGANVFASRVYPACKTHRGLVGRGLFPPNGRVAVVSIATSFTTEHDCPRNGWTLDEIAATIVNDAHADTVSQLDGLACSAKPPT